MHPRGHATVQLELLVPRTWPHPVKEFWPNGTSESDIESFTEESSRIAILTLLRTSQAHAIS